MATTTLGGNSVTFSNSTAAYSGGTLIDENAASYAVTFDVLALGGGGPKATLYSVDDGISSGLIPTANKGFNAFNTDLLAADRIGAANAETSRLGARFWIGEDKKIHYDASGIADAIHRLGVGETGGSGNDVIRFLSVFDSGDTITDFTAGEDKIDLSSFKDASGTVFHFAGFSATTPAAHSLWQVNYGIFGDMDGDLTTYEFTFNVQANTTLAATDFQL